MAPPLKNNPKKIIRHVIQWAGIVAGIGSQFLGWLPGWAGALISVVGGLATRIPTILDEKKDSKGRPLYDPTVDNDHDPTSPL